MARLPTVRSRGDFIATLLLRVRWRELETGSLNEVSGVPSRFKDLLEQERKEWLKVYEKLYTSWSADHVPRWKVDFSSNRNDVKMRMVTNTPVFVYLSEGTKVRYAKMKRSFKPKTRRRRFGKYGQGGQVAFVSPKLKGGLTGAGIEAREWHFELARRRQPKFAKRARRMYIRWGKQLSRSRKGKKGRAVLAFKV